MKQKRDGLDEMLLNMIEEGSLQWPKDKSKDLMELIDAIENPIHQVNEAGAMLEVLLSPLVDSDRPIMMISTKQVTALRGVVTNLQYIYSSLYENYVAAYKAACKANNPENKKD